MAMNNETILVNAYLQGTNDFQQRLPYPTQQSIAKFTEELFAPYNTDLYNQFIGLMNMIAYTYVMGRRFDNPLAEFKKERIVGGGKTIREIAPKWFKAHSYNPDSKTLLRLEKPEFEQWFYTVNRQDQYRFSWIKEELRFAMLEGGASGYGLNSLLAATMDALVSSDNYDEYKAMLALFSEANSYWNKPFYTKHLDAAPTDEASCKQFLQAVRELVYSLAIQPTKLYNAVDIPVYAKPEELILFTTPAVRAALDVQALAAAFNLDYVTTKSRIVTVPVDAFGINNTYAILTTVDFFEVRDVVYGIEAAPYNPDNMSNKYYLQHWEMIAANPLVPVIRFSTDEETTNLVYKEKFIVFNITADTEEVKAGGTVQLKPFLAGTITNENTGESVSRLNEEMVNLDGVTVAPDSAVYTVKCNTAELNSRTYVDRYNVLHVQKSIDVGTVITVKGMCTHKDAELEAEMMFTIVK